MPNGIEQHNQEIFQALSEVSQRVAMLHAAIEKATELESIHRTHAKDELSRLESVVAGLQRGSERFVENLRELERRLDTAEALAERIRMLQKSVDTLRARIEDMQAKQRPNWTVLAPAIISVVALISQMLGFKPIIMPASTNPASVERTIEAPLMSEPSSSEP